MGLIVLTSKVDRPLLQQGLGNLYVFPQVGQGLLKVDAKGLFHTPTVAGAQSQSETTRSQLSQDQRLLSDRYGMAGEDLGDGKSLFFKLTR